MSNRIQVSRRSLASVLAGALFAGTLALPASAPAATAPEMKVPAARTCSSQTTQTLYNFYSNSTYTTIVGRAHLDCDGVYTVTEGYETPYVRTKTFECPI